MFVIQELSKRGHSAGQLRVYTVRFRPGEELKSGLLQFARDRGLRAAFIMTCVGSLTKATLRMAAANDGGKYVRVVLFVPELRSWP